MIISKNAYEEKLIAQREVERSPNDPAAWIRLSKAAGLLLDTEQKVRAAHRAYELAPTSLDTLRQMALSADEDMTAWGLADARMWYDRYREAAPDEPLSLLNDYQYSFLDEDYDRALKASRTLERIDPSNPTLAHRTGQALRAAGKIEEAAHAFARAARLCDDLPFPCGPFANLKPMYTALAGDAAEADRLARVLCCERGLGLANVENPSYPADLLSALAKRRDHVAGRDLFVFGNGPSLAEPVARRDEFAPLDFATMTMTTFRIAQADIFHPLGRDVDFTCMPHPADLMRDFEHVLEWLTSYPKGTLLLPLWTKEIAASLPSFRLPDTSRILWFDCFSEFMPDPKEPMRVPAIISLLCALTIALHLAPRRIFLFGFNASIAGNDVAAEGALYYKELDTRYHANVARRSELKVRDFSRRWGQRDAMMFNDAAPHSLRQTSLLFDLPLPPIYNVCIGSGLTVFPRISFDDFLAIART